MTLFGLQKRVLWRAIRRGGGGCLNEKKKTETFSGRVCGSLMKKK